MLLRYPELRVLPHPVQSDKVHLKAAMDWLCAAQDAAPHDDGVNASYDLWKKTWGRYSYRETTGYIIETFLAYYGLTDNKEYMERAVRMGDWEIAVQAADGAVWEERKGEKNGKKIFNTGQVMIGWLALYRAGLGQKYLDASGRAAAWLVAQQAPDGSWPTYTSSGEAQTIETRVAWPLLEYAIIVGDQAARAAAERHLTWVMSVQEPDGWFNNTAFAPGIAPWTHQIAYTVSGLLECYKLLGANDKKLFDAFYTPAVKLLEIAEQTYPRFLAGSFDKGWRADTRYTCLTGDAQLAIIWTQIYQLTGEERFKRGADTIIEQLKTTQLLSKNKNTHGGILGSYPIDGHYAPYALPNWAAKFFADALLLKIGSTSQQ